MRGGRRPLRVLSDEDEDRGAGPTEPTGPSGPRRSEVLLRGSLRNVREPPASSSPRPVKETQSGRKTEQFRALEEVSGAKPRGSFQLPEHSKLKSKHPHMLARKSKGSSNFNLLQDPSGMSQ